MASDPGLTALLLWTVSLHGVGTAGTNGNQGKTEWRVPTLELNNVRWLPDPHTHTLPDLAIDSANAFGYGYLLERQSFFPRKTQKKSCVCVCVRTHFDSAHTGCVSAAVTVHVSACSSPPPLKCVRVRAVS